MLQNICIFKPSRQSSTSQYSSNADPDVDSKGGNNGNLDVEYGFHTGLERDPWWQVDLEQAFELHSIKIYNRRNCQERLSRFSILRSMDGINFETIYSKIDGELFGCDEANCFKLNFEQRVVARYIRIRLDGFNVLHFKEAEIYGEPAIGEACTSCLGVEACEDKFVFSALYNESSSFLKAFIANFIAYAGTNCFLVLNVRSLDLADGLDCRNNERIFIHKGDIERQKMGHTLLLGHLENVAFAEDNIPNYNFFCTIASNSLFVRQFNPSETLKSLREGPKVPVDCDIDFFHGVDIANLPDHWWWTRLKNEPAAIEYALSKWGLKYLTQNQIEGFISSRANWLKLHSIRKDIEDFGKIFNTGSLAPLEEMLPASLIQFFGDGRYTNICHVYWQRFRKNPAQGVVTLAEVVNVDNTFQPHVCMLKWFERDTSCEQTFAVTEKWCIDFIDIVRFSLASSNPKDREKNIRLMSSILDTVIY